jgi:hypothetical protein
MGTMTARAAARVYAALRGHIDAFGYSPARPAEMYPGSAFGMLGGNNHRDPCRPGRH